VPRRLLVLLGLLVGLLVPARAGAGCVARPELLVTGRVASSISVVDVLGCGSRVVATAVPQAEPVPAGATVSDASWLPDGSFVYGWTHTEAGVPDRSEVRRGDLRGHYRTVARLDLPGALGQVVASPDGQRVVLALREQVSGSTQTQALHLLDLRTGALSVLSLDRGAYDGDPSWSPDGRFVAYRSDRPTATLVVADVRLGLTSSVSPSGLVATRPSWSPDGRWIAFEGSDAVGSLLADTWLVRPDGALPRRVHAAAGEPAWAPDSRRLVVTTPDGLEVVDTRTGAVRRVTGDGGDTDAVWSPDGGAIAYRHVEAPWSFRDGVYVVRLAAGSAHRVLPWADAGPPVWRP
jgi:Tol biopolymer transport system component